MKSSTHRIPLLVSGLIAAAFAIGAVTLNQDIESSKDEDFESPLFQNDASFLSGKKASSKPATSIKRKVTYSSDVASLLNEKCVSCHYSGGVAPFSLIGYENAKKHRETVVDAVSSRRMPPWKAVHGFGSFRDENRLTDDQIETLKTWAKTGAERGNIKKEPKAPKINDEWAAGKPDLVLTPQKAFRLEAEGDDVYRNFVFDLGNKEPVYVVGMDVKPGNKKVVHHVIAFLDQSGRSQKLAERSNDGQEGYNSSGGGIGVAPSGALGGWAPGVSVQKADPGTAYKIEPGTKVVVQVHYHKSGKPEVDQTKLGIYTTNKAPERQLDIFWAANPLFRIPVGAQKHEVKWTEKIPVDSTVYSVMPHMHLLGKSMKAVATKPDGTEIPLVFVDDWDFNWQLVYRLKEPLFLPKGSKIAIQAVYDNSEKNPYAVNRPVTWGEQTTDEMALLILVYSTGEPISFQDQMKAKLKDRIQGLGRGQ